MFRAAVVGASVLARLSVAVPVACGTPVIIDPDAGWSGCFVWKQGVGPIAGISTAEFDYYEQESWVLGDTEWSITPPTVGLCR